MSVLDYISLLPPTTPKFVCDEIDFIMSIDKDHKALDFLRKSQPDESVISVETEQFCDHKIYKLRGLIQYVDSWTSCVDVWEYESKFSIVHISPGMDDEPDFIMVDSDIPLSDSEKIIYYKYYEKRLTCIFSKRIRKIFFKKD